MSAFTVIMNKLFNPDDTLAFHVVSKDEPAAVRMINRVYPNLTDAETESTYYYMINQLIRPGEKIPTYKETIVGKWLWRSTWISFFIGAGNAMSGLILITTYSLTMFKDIEASGVVSAISPSASVTIIGFMGVIGSLISPFTNKYMKRRHLFMVFHFLVGVGMALIAIFYALKQPELMMICICFNHIFFQVGTGSGVWTYVGEVSNEIGMALTFAIIMGLFTIQTSVVTYVVKAIGVSALYYFYAGFQMFVVVFLFVFMKETKGLTQE